MKVLIDGKEVVCHNDVKVIYDHQEYYDEDREGNGVQVEPHLIITHEGIILDNIAQNEEGQVFSTMSQEINDLIELCQ